MNPSPRLFRPHRSSQSAFSFFYSPNSINISFCQTSTFATDTVADQIVCKRPRLYMNMNIYIYIVLCIYKYNCVYIKICSRSFAFCFDYWYWSWLMTMNGKQTSKDKALKEPLGIIGNTPFWSPCLFPLWNGGVSAISNILGHHFIENCVCVCARAWCCFCCFFLSTMMWHECEMKKKQHVMLLPTCMKTYEN